jgi:hypothetical protein
LDLLKARGDKGCTIDEFAQYMNVPPNAISGRFVELAEKGKICKTPLRRKTRSGKQAVVYFLGTWTDYMLPKESREEATEKVRQYKHRLAERGHGHIVQRNDARKDGCGGPVICRVCRQERDYLEFLESKITA